MPLFQLNNIMKKLRLLPLTIVSFVTVGCGGGGSGTAGNSGGQDNAFGPFITRAQGGTPQVGTLSSGGPTVTSVAGVAFTKITYTPTPSLFNTRIAYTRGTFQGFNSLNICWPDGGADHPMPGVTGAFGKLSWSRDGRIAFTHISTSPVVFQIWVVNSDGSNAHNISSTPYADKDPTWSSDNFHIAFSKTDGTGHAQIYSMTASGGSVTHLSDGSADDTNPSWSPDGSTIYFVRYDAPLSRHEIWKMNANGSSPAIVVGGFDSPQESVSPLGNAVAALGTSPSQLNLWPLPNGTGDGLLAEASTTYELGNWAPDGSRILFVKTTPSLATEIDTIRPDGFSETTVLAHNDVSTGDAAWEPFALPIPYVASTGGSVFGTSSSGFIYGAFGDRFCSFLSFTATTPSSATAVADPVIFGQSNLIYRLSADAITSLKFVNGFGGGVNAPQIGAGVKSAVVSISAASGMVSSVVTLASKQALSSVVSKQGGRLLSGPFMGVYDAHGVNLAPRGATSVTLGKNGEVISVSSN